MEHKFAENMMKLIVFILKMLDPKPLSDIWRRETEPYASILTSN